MKGHIWLCSFSLLIIDICNKQESYWSLYNLCTKLYWLRNCTPINYHCLLHLAEGKRWMWLTLQFFRDQLGSLTLHTQSRCSKDMEKACPLSCLLHMASFWCWLPQQNQLFHPVCRSFYPSIWHMILWYISLLVFPPFENVSYFKIKTVSYSVFVFILPGTLSGNG